MPPRLIGHLVLMLFASFVAWVGPGPAAAQTQPFKTVGDEGVVGNNRTGEECRLRLLERRTDQGFFERYGIFCEGWGQPSGEVRRFGIPHGSTHEKVLTEGSAYETRMGDCKPVEPTTISAGGAATLPECRRLDGAPRRRSPRRRRPQHPFFWAPFVLVGDGGTPPRP